MEPEFSKKRKVKKMWTSLSARKKEEKQEVLMALLLSLSAHCDSQSQLLTKTTSYQRRIKVHQGGVENKEDQGKGVEEKKMRAGALMYQK